MKVVHSWIKEYVGDALPDTRTVADLLTFHSFEIDGIEEIAGDTVLDVDVLPNRSSDCLCHRGVAREIATLLDVPLANDPLQQEINLAETDKISIEIEDKDDCPRFTASLMTGIEVKESPGWLKTHLEAIGVRSINNIVDATNYVMFALGEPLHAYDADLFPQVDGKWQFVVRKAREGEEVSLLGESGSTEDRIVVCKGTELLIVDGSSDTPIGLAGVKGGRFAGVHEATKNIIIEAAHFNPTLTRKTARGLGIVIDASKRFENEPSRELPPYAQVEVITLIQKIAGGNFDGYIDEYLESKPNPTVTVTMAKTNALLGLSLTTEEIGAIIKRTGSAVQVEGEVVQATGPWERTDLNIEEDFIEEVGRIYGLDKVESVVPEKIAAKQMNKRQYYSDKVRAALTGIGFSEVITSSFQKKGKIQLQNALASDKSYVRGNLRKNIEATLDKNFVHTDLLGITDVRVFEIGTVFTPGEAGINEHASLALGVRTKGNGYSPKDDKLVDDAVLTLNECLKTDLPTPVNAHSSGVTKSGSAFNYEKGVFEVNLTELIAHLPEPEAYAVFEKSADVTYKAPSPYPAIARDIALWVPEETDATSLQSVLAEAAGGLMVRIDLFDTFTKGDRTSHAFRLVFQSYEKTLTDEEVNRHMEKVYAVAAERNWEVR